ncbi:MAG: chromophore lyase CpcT/CpeT [Phycisphaerales bacterium]
MLSVTVALVHSLATVCAVPRDVPPDLEKLASLMQGSFSSEEQSKQDPEFFDIRLKMCRIWETRSGDGIWLYVEQAAAASVDKPYRQRVYHLSAMTYSGGDGQSVTTFVSEVWMLPGDPLEFAGGCDDPVKLAALKPERMDRKDGCQVVLICKDGGVFEGGTIGRECPSERQGATHTTSTVRVDADGLVTWDRGFDDTGKQVWGSAKGPYRFRRVSTPPAETK